MDATLLIFELPDWQTMLSLLIVAIAMLVLFRRLWSSLKAGSENSSCGSCSGCGHHPASQGLKKTELFQLESRSE